MRDLGADGRLDELRLLVVVDQLRAGGRAGAGVAADVLERDAHELLQPGRHERPASHVLRLFLDPDPVAGRSVAVEDLLELLGRPGIELLEADDGDVALLAGRLPLGQQVVVDLARAEQHAAGPLRGGRVVEHVVEVAHDQVVDRGDGRLVPQQALGGHHDQRLAEVPPDLAAEQVEVLGGRRGDGDLDVLLGAEREEALQPGAGVLGPLALVAVRQEHDQAAAPAPLGLGRGDELVDDDLGAVGEVAELGLPHDEHVGLVQRVAVVESEHGGLGEQAVVDAELGLARRQVVQRRPALAGVLVDERRRAAG